MVSRCHASRDGLAIPDALDTSKTSVRSQHITSPFRVYFLATSPWGVTSCFFTPFFSKELVSFRDEKSVGM